MNNIFPNQHNNCITDSLINLPRTTIATIFHQYRVRANVYVEGTYLEVHSTGRWPPPFTFRKFYGRCTNSIHVASWLRPVWVFVLVLRGRKQTDDCGTRYYLPLTWLERKITLARTKLSHFAFLCSKSFLLNCQPNILLPLSTEVVELHLYSCFLST